MLSEQGNTRSSGRRGATHGSNHWQEEAARWREYIETRLYSKLIDAHHNHRLVKQIGRMSTSRHNKILSVL